MYSQHVSYGVRLNADTLGSSPVHRFPWVTYRHSIYMNIIQQSSKYD